MKQIEKILADFAQVKVLVVGDIMLDRYWWGSVSRISPEAPVPIVKLEKVTATAGGAANVAANIAGLGAKAFLVGLIGKDSNGAEFKEVLQNVNISADFLVETSARPTITKTRVIAQHQQVARIDEEIVNLQSEQEANELFRKIAEIMPNVDMVILSDYAKGCLTDELIGKTIALGKAEGKRILVDPKGKNFQKYKGATLLTPNKNEAFAAFEKELTTQVTVEDIGCNLLKKLVLETLLITLGEDGMMVFSADKKPILIPTQTRKVYDVTGAGDTVIATLAVGLSIGLDMVEAARLANLCAGIVVEKLGTTAINQIDLQNAWETEQGSL